MADVMEEIGIVNENQPSDLNVRWTLVLALAAGCGLLFYYGPLISCNADVYCSDLTFYFEPFSRFIGENARKGILAMWNPMLYAGMSQIATPSPGMFYPPSWFMFLLPFSCGLGCYMLFHQSLMGLGSYLLLRDLRFTRASSIFASSVLTLCAYNFSFLRNFTLPGSMAWFPLALYFCRKIHAKNGWHSFGWMLGLAFCVSMLVYVGRPEVGVPELLLIGVACVWSLFVEIFQTRLAKGNQNRKDDATSESASNSAEVLSPEIDKHLVLSTVIRLACIVLGIAWALPTVFPGVEWTALSPRSQGMALKWVFTWSANWFDFLCIVLSNPFGDLCRLTDQAAHIRQMVLSRGSHLPFLSSAYLSPFVVTLAFFALFDRKNQLKRLSILIFLGFSLMAAGNYTPFAPSIVKLSSALASLRYPVKLLIFPCLSLILLAALGSEMLLKRRIPALALKSASITWTTLLILGFILGYFPQIGFEATKLSFLFHKTPELSLVKSTQYMLADSIQGAAVLGLICCLLVYGALKNKLKPELSISLITVMTIIALIQSSWTFSNYTKFGFYEHKSSVASTIEELRNDTKYGATASRNSGRSASRVLNLFFDPVSVPETYEYYRNCEFDESFFQYCREVLLYQSIMDARFHSSYGYEAAETADYKNCYTDVYLSSSQHQRKDGEKRTISDLPLHRFCALTATEFANSQIYKLHPYYSIPILDPKKFELVKSNRKMNFRVYRVLNPRPRVYLTSNLCFVESFKDLEKVVCSPEDVPQTQTLDASRDITYILNRDKLKNKLFFESLSNNSETANSSSKNIGESPDQHESTNHKTSDKQNPNNAEDAAFIAFDNGQSFTVSVESKTPKVLVIADHFYPGWTVTVDGKEVNSLKVNLLNRGVLIDAGRHQVSLNYAPRSLGDAIKIAIAASIIFLIFFGGLMRRLKQKKCPKQM